MRRSFLVLQGTASPFFRELAGALCGRKHEVRRINFCGGDLLYSRGTGDRNFSGAANDLIAWYTKEIQSGNYTDLLMFGDCRAIHEPVQNFVCKA